MTLLFTYETATKSTNNADAYAETRQQELSSS